MVREVARPGQRRGQALFSPSLQPYSPSSVFSMTVYLLPNPLEAGISPPALEEMHMTYKYRKLPTLRKGMRMTILSLGRVFKQKKV